MTKFVNMFLLLLCYQYYRPSTRLVETRARQHGPCWRVMETGHPLTRAVNSGSGNRALVHADVIMVACSSIARARLPLYFMAVYLFISSDAGKPTSPKLSHTTWLSIQQNLCYTDFFKVPPKMNGGRKTQNLYHFCAKSRTISTVRLCCAKRL